MKSLWESRNLKKCTNSAKEVDPVDAAALMVLLFAGMG